MNPLRLTLKNFLGIRAGLGRDEITIDFIAIEGELIAITGETGRGKTSILDSCHPFRLMPSRASSYSPGSFSYYDHTFDNASKELEFEHGGQVYRSILNIKGGGKTKKTEAYLQVQKGEAWAPLNDGKTQTYDAALAEVMGSPELYFTSAFACQGRPLLANYTNGDIKSMLAELLNLEHIKNLGMQAKEKRDTAKDKLEDLQAKALKADEEALALTEAETLLTEAEATAQAAASDVATQESKVQALREDLVRAQEQVKNQEATITRREEIKAVMAKEHGAADIVNADYETAVAGVKRHHDSAIHQARQIVGQNNVAIAGQQRRLTDAQAILERKDDIESADSKLGELVEGQEELNADAEAAQSAVDALNALKAKRSRVDGTLTQLEAQILGFETNINDLTRRAALIEQVPCTTNQEYVTTCPLLQDAREGAAKKSTVTAGLEETRDARLSALAEIEGLDGQMCDLIIPDMPEIRAKISANQISQRECSKLAAMKSQLDAAAETLVTAPQAIATAEQAIAGAEEHLATVQGEIEKQIQDAITKRDAALVEHRQAYAEAQEKLKALPDVDAIDIETIDSKVGVGVTALNDLKDKFIESTERVSRIKADIELRKKNAPVAVAGEMEAAEFNLAQWALLTKALGNDGIVALSIDDCGGTIASIANELLLVCYGPRFTVKIVTQTESATGTLREDFDILVYDGETGDHKSVSKMSGGETTIVNEVITRAIGLFQAQNSGQVYGALFGDEDDGGLSAEKKVQFIQLKRETMKIGGYKRNYFVSHSPELWALADAVINVDGMLARLEKAA